MQRNVGTTSKLAKLNTLCVRVAMYFFAVVISSLSFTMTGILTDRTYAQGNCDTAFLSANGIYWSNPCAATCSISSADGNFGDSTETAEAIFKYLTSTDFAPLGNKPMNAVQAAGFMGNIYQESRYDSSAIQGGQPYTERKAMDGTIGGYAFGLVQWDSGRRVALLKFADKEKASGTTVEDAWKDPAIQLNYLKSELEGSEKGILTDSKFASAQQASDLKTATERVTTVFERAGSPNMTARYKAADEAYAKYKDLAPSTGTIAAGGCANTAQGNGDIVATAEDLSWATRSTERGADHSALEPKASYTKALQATGVNHLGDSCSMLGNSCDAFVATVMRYSGVDPDFPCCGANAQNEYMKTHTDKYQMVQANVKSTDELKPGYILWRDGHIKIYLGDGKEAAASHCERTAEQSPLYLDGTYYAYAAI